MLFTYFGYTYENPFADITVTMEDGFPKLQPPCSTEPVKRSVPEFIKELKWLVIILQAIVIVSIALILFTLFLHQPFTKATHPIEDDINIMPNVTPDVAYTETIEKSIAELFSGEEEEDSSKSREVEYDIDLNSTEVAVYSDDVDCSMLGRSILLRGGNAIDSAIVTTFCTSAVLPQRCGLGGGLMATVLKNGICKTVIARETTGIAAQASNFSRRPVEAIEGPKAIGIPGFLSGLFTLYQDYSSKKLSWKQLLLPIIEMCRRGIRVKKELANDLIDLKTKILLDPFMRDTFINKDTHDTLKEGDIMYCSSLADTMTEISEYEDEGDSFYKGGTVGQQLIKELQDKGGILTAEDFEDYVSEKKDGLTSKINEDVLMCGPQFPSVFLNIQQAIRASKEHPEYIQDIIGLSKKDSEIAGDLLFSSRLKAISEILLQENSSNSLIDRLKRGERSPSKDEFKDAGTSVLVIDETGLAVAMSSSIGQKFGSKIYSRYGFFMNNAMASFDHNNYESIVRLEDRHSNILQPGKSPRSLLSPIIGYNTNTRNISFITSGTDFSSIVHSIVSIFDKSVRNFNSTTPLIFVRAQIAELMFGLSSNLVGY